MIIVELYGAQDTHLANEIYSHFTSLDLNCDLIAQCSEWPDDKYSIASAFIEAANVYRQYKELELSGVELVVANRPLSHLRVYKQKDAISNELRPILEIHQQEFEILRALTNSEQSGDLLEAARAVSFDIGTDMVMPLIHQIEDKLQKLCA